MPWDVHADAQPNHPFLRSMPLPSLSNSLCPRLRMQIHSIIIHFHISMPLPPLSNSLCSRLRMQIPSIIIHSYFSMPLPSPSNNLHSISCTWSLALHLFFFIACPSSLTLHLLPPLLLTTCTPSLALDLLHFVCSASSLALHLSHFISCPLSNPRCFKHALPQTTWNMPSLKLHTV